MQADAIHYSSLVKSDMHYNGLAVNIL